MTTNQLLDLILSAIDSEPDFENILELAMDQVTLETLPEFEAVNS